MADGTEAVAPLKGHKRGVLRGAAFSPDSRTLATASDENVTKLWNVDTGQEIVTFDSAVFPLFSPDGNTLALRVGGNIRLVRVSSLAEIDATEKPSPDRK